MATAASTSSPLYRLRSMEMLKLRVANKTYKEIAAIYNCHTETVIRALAWANRQGLAADYENQILSDLVPEAIKVYKAKLAEGDEFVAKDVIDKLVKLGDRFSQREANQEEQGLRAYLEDKRTAKIVAVDKNNRGRTADGRLTPGPRIYKDEHEPSGSGSHSGSHSDNGNQTDQSSTTAVGFASTYLGDFATEDTQAGESENETAVGEFGDANGLSEED